MELEAHEWRKSIVRLFGFTSTSAAIEPPAELIQELSAIGIALPGACMAFAEQASEARDRSPAALGDFDFLSPQEILRNWRDQRNIARAYRDDDAEEVDDSVASHVDPRVRRVAFDERRVPIANFNGDIWIYLDFWPAPKGTSGQVIQVDAESLSWFWLAPNLETLICELADGGSLNPDLGVAE